MFSVFGKGGKEGIRGGWGPKAFGGSVASGREDLWSSGQEVS